MLQPMHKSQRMVDARERRRGRRAFLSNGVLAAAAAAGQAKAELDAAALAKRAAEQQGRGGSHLRKLEDKRLEWKKKHAEAAKRVREAQERLEAAAEARKLRLRARGKAAAADERPPSEDDESDFSDFAAHHWERKPRALVSGRCWVDLRRKRLDFVGERQEENPVRREEEEYFFSFFRSFACFLFLSPHFLSLKPFFLLSVFPSSSPLDITTKQPTPEESLEVHRWFYLKNTQIISRVPGPPSPGEEGEPVPQLFPDVFALELAEFPTSQLNVAPDPEEASGDLRDALARPEAVEERRVGRSARMRAAEEETTFDLRVVVQVRECSFFFFFKEEFSEGKKKLSVFRFKKKKTQRFSFKKKKKHFTTKQQLSAEDVEKFLTGQPVPPPQSPPFVLPFDDDEEEEVEEEEVKERGKGKEKDKEGGKGKQRSAPPAPPSSSSSSSPRPPAPPIEIKPVFALPDNLHTDVYELYDDGEEEEEGTTAGGRRASRRTRRTRKVRAVAFCVQALRVPLTQPRRLAAAAAAAAASYAPGGPFAKEAPQAMQHATLLLDSAEDFEKVVLALRAAEEAEARSRALELAHSRRCRRAQEAARRRQLEEMLQAAGLRARGLRMLGGGLEGGGGGELELPPAEPVLFEYAR